VPHRCQHGAQQFHGEKELFKSEHVDPIAASTITGKCRVLTLKQYQVRRPAACVLSRGTGLARSQHVSSGGLVRTCRGQACLELNQGISVLVTVLVNAVEHACFTSHCPRSLSCPQSPLNLGMSGAELGQYR